MARFNRTAPYRGKGQKFLDARYQRLISAGSDIAARFPSPSGHAVVGTPGLRKAIFAEEIRLGLGNISPLGQWHHLPGGVGRAASDLAKSFA